MLVGVHAADPTHTLSNSVISASFSERGLCTLARSDGSQPALDIAGDDFLIELDGLPTTSATKVLSSKKASGPPSAQPGANETSLAVLWHFDELSVEVRYSLVSLDAAFVEKQLTIIDRKSKNAVHNISRITLFDNVRVARKGTTPIASTTASSHYGLGAYAVFHRFDANSGAFITAQNPYLSATTAKNGTTSLAYAPLMLFETDKASTFEIDAGLIGLTTLTGKAKQDSHTTATRRRRCCACCLNRQRVH